MKGDHKQIFISVWLIEILLPNDNFIHIIITTWSMRKPTLVAHVGVCMLSVACKSLKDSHPFTYSIVLKVAQKPTNQHNLEFVSGHQISEMVDIYIISTHVSCESNPMFGWRINEHKRTKNNSKFRMMSYQSWILSFKLSIFAYLHVYVDLTIKQYSLH